MTTKKIRLSRFTFTSIKAKIALLCTCSIIIAASATSIYLTTVSREAITTSSETTIQNSADSYSSSLSSALEQIGRSANFMMGSGTVSSFVDSNGSKYKAEVKELANSYLSSNTSVEDISIIDKNGLVLYSSNSSLTGKDLSKENYFTNMVSSGLETQGNVFISESSGEACVPFAVPLRVMEMPGMNMPSDNSSSADAAQPGDAAGTKASQTEEAATTNAANQSGDLQQQPVTEFTGAIVISEKVSGFTQDLAKITVGTYKTGYAFLFDTNGKIIYHPDNSLIGTTVDVKEINDIVTQVKSNSTAKAKIFTYTFNNTSKYAGFSVLSYNQWILFVATDKSEVLSSLNTIFRNTFLIIASLVLLLSILTYLFTGTITSSIKKITQLINKTAELDFTEDQSFAVLSKRSDETGEMSRAIEKMRDSMKTMIVQISGVSNKITESSDRLNNISNMVNDHSSDNSATTQELSASMQETAATTEQINTTIEQIGNNSNEITEKVALGTELSEGIIRRAFEIKVATLTATDATQKTYENVKKKTDAAIKQSKAVEKINVLTKTIKEIASQTNLLALNASIEAARAGDAGSGFSVVAREIGELANQSSNTVSHITETVNEVFKAVQNMSDSLEQTLAFLESNVLKDYDSFIRNSEEYNKDAEIMSSTMENIQKQIDQLNSNVLGISDSISEINLMVSESSHGVSDVAAKNTNIVSLTSQTQNMAKENKEFANGLREIVDKFKL